MKKKELNPISKTIREWAMQLPCRTEALSSADVFTPEMPTTDIAEFIFLRREKVMFSIVSVNWNSLILGFSEGLIAILSKYDFYIYSHIRAGDAYLCSKDSIHIHFDFDASVMAVFYAIDNTAAKKVISEVSKLADSSKKPRVKQIPQGNIYMLGMVGKGFNTRMDFVPTKIKKPDVEIGTNYNDDFAEVHESICKSLNEEGKGIAILHGIPGSGKSYYLRLLSHLVPKKKMLYVPSELAHSIVEPSFMTLLKKHKKSVLLIEDADNVLRKREETTTQVASTILNLTDGFMNDVLGMQVVCTFNIERDQIDPAFMREGRLIAEYRFEKLKKDKANALCSKLGLEPDFTDDASLAEVYNKNKKRIASKSKNLKIGFN